MDDIKLIISARKKDVPINKFLSVNNQIESVFGFVEHTPLYGGRLFWQPEITEDDVKFLYDNNIGLNLPLTNLYSSIDDYKKSLPILEKYHRTGNSITVYRDDIAKLIRQDFPLYKLSASCIKEINTLQSIEDNLKIYDKVVLKSILNENVELLKSIEDKSKIILFANAGAAHGCKSKVCHVGRSKCNITWTPDSNVKYLEEYPIKCARRMCGDEGPGFQTFDIRMLYDLGFKCYKVLRKMSHLRAF